MGSFFDNVFARGQENTVSSNDRDLRLQNKETQDLFALPIAAAKLGGPRDAFKKVFQKTSF